MCFEFNFYEDLLGINFSHVSGCNNFMYSGNTTWVLIL